MSFDTGYVSAMADQWEHGKRPHAPDRRVRVGADLRGNSGRSARAHQAPDARFARLRHLRRQSANGAASCGETLEQLDATRTTSIWGTDRSLSSPHAALVNGTQVQGFELDDVHREGVLHVGAVTLPALIAVAESHAQTLRPRFPRRRASPATRSGRASACAWARSISARAGIPARRVGVFSAAAGAARALGARCRSRPCMRSASPARNRPA